jgi:hypothetical protein
MPAEAAIEYEDCGRSAKRYAARFPKDRTPAAPSSGICDQSRGFCRSSSAPPAATSSFASRVGTVAVREIDVGRPAGDVSDHEHLRDALAAPVSSVRRCLRGLRVGGCAGPRRAGTHRDADARLRVRVRRSVRGVPTSSASNRERHA